MDNKEMFIVLTYNVITFCQGIYTVGSICVIYICTGLLNKMWTDCK